MSKARALQRIVTRVKRLDPRLRDVFVESVRSRLVRDREVLASRKRVNKEFLNIEGGISYGIRLLEKLER